MKKNLNYIFVSVLMFLLASCVSYKENNEYAKDYNILDKNKFAKKYFTLYNNQIIDFTQIKKEKPYFTFRNNDTFQIVIFVEDGYLYDSQLMPLIMLDKAISVQKLSRSSFFSVVKNVIKLENIAASPDDVYTIIEEGVIKNDTILMKKKYHSKGYKNMRNLFNKYILISKIMVHKFGNDYFIESK